VPKRGHRRAGRHPQQPRRIPAQYLCFASAEIGRAPITDRLLHVADLVRVVGAEHDVVSAMKAIANCSALGSVHGVEPAVRLK
jgi:hypothetical protein